MQKREEGCCKICYEKTTPKTGIQCNGACKCWVHYGCLNYTPGIIKDIKAGLITVTCPCPECKSDADREDQGTSAMSCSSPKCPSRSYEPETAQCPQKSYKCSSKNCKKNLVNKPSITSVRKKNDLSFEFSTMSAVKSATSVYPYEGVKMSSRSETTLNALEQLLDSVGEFTKQLNGIICQMKNKSPKPPAVVTNHAKSNKTCVCPKRRC